MRKHFLVLCIIFFAGVCFTAVNNSGLKACGTKTTACKASLQVEIKTPGTDHFEEADPALFILVNPLLQ